ncbi:RHS repeat-associated core domain-containing protein [Flavobacterium soyae]|uniref:RHS repeat-associated core domain-containing protein n=1 Tax=Flavobacterium soyae TaxID=2903098 RepID=UPI001E5CBF0F|nr:RHS repeat-associated core domain-containing protein [Flavobacterium soyae]MCD9577070.1 FG-GAP-like repeat-containing protein [Flavobacterium soyae]
MKQFYLFILLIFTSLGFSQNFTDTKGELQISASGTATYTLPIAVSPSIKGVAPTINLNYSSGVRGGIAGQGWSINSISTISRIATRRDIDGYVDGVDFDADDKLALDGQRLLLKTGMYWAANSTYETEYKSNTRIELKIEGTTTYFIVTAPDGSRSWYGSKGSGSLQNSVSVNSWYIVHFEDVYGNFIDYNYKTVTYNSTNQLYIDNIAFSGNAVAGIAAQNKITFTYRDARRVERDYLKGVAIYATKILENIQVIANNTYFRTYTLSHTFDTVLGYERLTSIQELNGFNEQSNPVVFEYNTSPSTPQRTEKEYVNNLDFNGVDLAGDFDGDGRLDFTAVGNLYNNLFKNDSGQNPINISGLSSLYKSTITTLKNSKINQFNSILNLQNDELNSLTFGVFSLNNNALLLDYTKTIDIPNSGECNSNCVPNRCTDDGFVKKHNEYIEGDFNGDGISELLILGYSEYRNYNSEDPTKRDCVFEETVGSTPNICRLLDLNPSSSITLGTIGYANIGTTLASNLKGDKRMVADWNGDGKSDILVISGNKTYKIVGFKQLVAAPWVQLEIIGSGTLDQYSNTKQLLLGDFNGDGKTDIMIPTSEGAANAVQWNIYYSNPNPAGGEFFVKEFLDIVEYWPDTGSTYNTQRHFSSYFAMDINKDGKSDLVRVWRKYYKDDWSINNHDTQWQVTGFSNNIGKVGGSGFALAYDSTVFTSNSPDIPIPLTSNYRYDGGNTDLVLVRGHYTKIEYYQFNKNVDTENRLKSVTESNGNIKQTIDYLPMEAVGGGLGSASTDFYSSADAVTYPNIEVIRNTESYLVSKLTATINGVSKYQDFRYRGYVSNYNYGTVGFTRTTRSSWYLSAPDTKLWTTQYNDTALRGANTITWTSTNPLTVFDAVPTGLVSTKTNVFSTYTNPASKVYNVLLDSQTTVDALSGIKSENTYTYDGTVTSASYYGLETKSVSKQYNVSTLQGSVTTDSQYDNNPTGAGSAYYIGRPKKVNTLANNAVSGDTRTSEEAYTYSGFNLTKTEKKGHNTYALVEDMTYDGLGNLLTKTVSAPGAPAPVPAARTITDEYDAGKRFVVKKTDHQGFITNYVYNNLGQVTKSTDYMGVVSDFIYDNWGKLTNTTITGSSTTPISTTIVYAKLGTGGYTTTTTNNLDAKTVVEYDVIGRAVKNSAKGFAANTMVTKQVVYDGLGRKQKESEPYFSTPSLWTSYEYDYLMRPTKITAPTGKIQTLSYSVLTTTSTDDGKVTTATVDALGNKVQTTDPGGTINFTYFANGQLKESDYQGNKVKIDIDGWGNKIRMEDPSAGVYTYSYDAFGQLKTETTPNGTTSLVYDAAGKTTEKTIAGTLTNSKTTYAYNTLNQITSSTYVDNIETKTTTNVYEYDTLKRLYKTTETTPYAVFVKQLAYDSLGRVEKETSTATASGKTSSKTVKNTYQNGFPWQILDDATQQVLWQTNSLNERGQLLTAAFGNGIGITNTYDQYGYVKQIKHDKTSPTAVNIMTLNTDFEIKRGNLNSRTNSLFSRNETYKYDGLDRLTEYTNGLGIQETQVYDDKGRITQNSVGTYEYDTAKTYQNKAITPTQEAVGYYGNREGIFNDSMEDRTGWGTERSPATVFYSYDNVTAAHTGKNSLKLANALTSEQYVYSDKWADINNTATTDYTYSAWVYSSSPQAELVLVMKDAQGVLSYNTVVSNVTGSWTQVTKTFSVPANIKKIRLRLDNNGQGNIWFDDVQIRKTSDAATAVRALNITYNTFKSPVQIEETGVDKISFTYNDGNDRSSMFYGGQQSDKLLRTFRKHYSADGTMEVKHNIVTGTVEFVIYIGGDGYSAPVVLKSDGTTQNYLYLHRDYQGTITAVSDQSGAVVEKRLFDAWGNIVKVQDGAGNILSGLTVLDRGYTGHEHLQSIGLIHMNGRLYDPKLHRFLQPDNYIQEPYNTQNYNKYGYVLNNPLKYTDPSGEYAEIGFLAVVGIGAAIAALTYTITALVADVPFSIGGLVKATFIGAATSAVTFGIGSAAGSLFSNFYSQAAFQAAAHGTFQGGMTAISGGKFWSGFAAGALSSIASSAWGGGMSSETVDNVTTETMHQGISGATGLNNGFGTIAFGTVSGGAGAALTGGNFWQGAVTGLFVSVLNHSFHESGDPNGTGLSTRRYHKDENGNIDSESLNYFPRGDTSLFSRAESEPLRLGELTVYGHANHQGLFDIFNYNQNMGVSNVLKSDSAMWRDFVSGKTNSLTMVLKACYSGSLEFQNNISRVLTKQNSGLTIYSASHNWGSDGRVFYTKANKVRHDGAGFNKYQDGRYLNQVKKK